MQSMQRHLARCTSVSPQPLWCGRPHCPAHVFCSVSVLDLLFLFRVSNMDLILSVSLFVRATSAPRVQPPPIFSTVTPSIVDCINHHGDCDGGLHLVLPACFILYVRVTLCFIPCRTMCAALSHLSHQYFFSSALFRVCVPDDFLVLCSSSPQLSVFHCSSPVCSTHFLSVLF